VRAKVGMLEHRGVQALERCGPAAPILEPETRNGVVEFRAVTELPRWMSSRPLKLMGKLGICA
jgi:hypothetical protein